MYPGNPNLMEKSIWNKADEMRHAVEKAHKFPATARRKSKKLAISGLLIALGWLFSLVF